MAPCEDGDNDDCEYVAEFTKLGSPVGFQKESVDIECAQADGHFAGVALVGNTRTLNFAAIVTNGPSPNEHKVLEAAAVKTSDGKEAGRFAELADAGPLSLAVKKLTGLSEARLIGHDTPCHVLERLLDFVSDGPTVVHGAQQLSEFALAEALRPPDALLDCAFLAQVVLPLSSDYSLEGLAEELGLERPRYRRALSSAMLTARIWQRLLREAQDLPEAVLVALCRMCEVAADPLLEVFGEAANRKVGFTLSSRRGPSLGGVLADHSELFSRAQDYRLPEPGNAPLAPQEMCEMFTPHGLVGRNLPGYEQRPEQVQMVREVCEALNESRHLVIEAGTGTGKSMAYLLPAAQWAIQNEDKVIISTNTKNLQEQLYNKDLPFLEGLLPGKFEAALLKGRRNYLCVRQFLHLMEHLELELRGPEEIRALLPLVVWASLTSSGDLSECTGFMLESCAPSLMPRLVSGAEECVGRACRWRNKCFVRRARTLAQLADLVVVNHALLFSDLGLDQPILPIYRCAVFDEAHNLEDAATNAFTISVDGLSVFRVTNRLCRKRKDGSLSGTLATILHEAKARLPDSSAGEREKIKELIQGVIEGNDRTVEATRQFFEVVGEPFAQIPTYQETLLLKECRPPVGPESESWQAAGALSKTILSLNKRIESLAEELELVERHLRNATELAHDLRAQAGHLNEVSQQIEFILSQKDPDYVYWLERRAREPRTFYSIHAAPLDIGKYIRTYFLDEKRCVVFTSATLKVNGTFGYMMERFGAHELDEGRIRCVGLGSSFDYDSQTLVCVPTFLPDPGGQRDRAFDEELGPFLIDLLAATRGRALILFTSYSLLDAVYAAIKGPLEKAGVIVLAQGRDGSREAITALFRKVTSSVLLGTQSFWEGVDVSGESLSCLLLTKLPFHVITDPLVRGRTEYMRSQGRDPFTHYTLPEAAIGFRQGFGRLIRSRTDHGVIVVTDRRLVTKAYGRCFLGSLPTRGRVFRDRETLIRAVSRFFARKAPRAR